MEAEISEAPRWADEEPWPSGVQNRRVEMGLPQIHLIGLLWHSGIASQILRPGFNPDLGCGLCEICTFSCSHASSRNWLQSPPTFQRQAGWQVNGPLWIAPSMDGRIWGSWLLCHSCANFSVTYSVVCGDGMTIINSIGRMDVILLHHKETRF